MVYGVTRSTQELEAVQDQHILFRPATSRSFLISLFFWLAACNRIEDNTSSWPRRRSSAQLTWTMADGAPDMAIVEDLEPPLASTLLEPRPTSITAE